MNSVTLTFYSPVVEVKSCYNVSSFNHLIPCTKKRLFNSCKTYDFHDNFVFFFKLPLIGAIKGIKFFLFICLLPIFKGYILLYQIQDFFLPR